MLTLYSVVGLVLAMAHGIDEGLVRRQFEVVLEDPEIAHDGAVECRVNILYSATDSQLLSIHGVVLTPCFSGDLVVTEVSGIDQKYVFKSPFVATGQYAPCRYLSISPQAGVVANIQISHFLTQEWHALPHEEKKLGLRSARVVLDVYVDEVPYEQVGDFRRAFLIDTPRDSFRRVRLKAVSKPVL